MKICKCIILKSTEKLIKLGISKYSEFMKFGYREGEIVPVIEQDHAKELVIIPRTKISFMFYEYLAEEIIDVEECKKRAPHLFI